MLDPSGTIMDYLPSWQLVLEKGALTSPMECLGDGPGNLRYSLWAM